MQDVQNYQVSSSEITWAHSYSKHQRLGEFLASLGLADCHHWSRFFEYPWVLENGNFSPNQCVLDAAGGDAPLQYFLASKGICVVNVDIQPPKRPPLWDCKVKRIEGDLRKLSDRDGTFDRVICLSVLEHIENPIEIVHELWRVLLPGGRLLITMDVADHVRHNHTIGHNEAKEIVSLFGLTLPNELPGTLMQFFPELDRSPHEPMGVFLKVICFYVDKPLFGINNGS
jgi:SAM-dependent methyltransferase